MKNKITFLTFAVILLLNFTQHVYGQTLPFELSTETNPKWYYIENAGVEAEYATGQVIKVEAMDTVCYWGIKTCTAAQLFRFEAVEGSPGGFRIINKAFPSGELLATTKYGTAVNTSWTVQLLTGANGDEYRIVSGSTVLSAQQVGLLLVSNDLGYNSASCWKFTPVGTSASLQADINSAQSLLDSTVEGNAFTQYPSAARSALASAIATANQFMSSIDSYTNDQITNAQITLNSAIQTYKHAVVGPISTAANPVWLVLQIQATDAERVRKVMAYNPDDATKRIMGLNSSLLEPTDKIVWRIEKDNTGYCAIVSKYDNVSVCSEFVNGFATCVTLPASPFPDFDWHLIAVDGYSLIYKFVFQKVTLHMSRISPYAFDNYDMGSMGSQFKVIPVSEFYKSVLKFTIDSIAPMKNAIVVGTEKGQYPQEAYDIIVAAFANAQGVHDSATATDAETLNARVALLAAWNSFKQSVSTGLYNQTSEVKVFVQDKKIVITGTDTLAKAYTVSGIQVDIAKPLAPGIYIVKVGSITARVVVL